MLALSNNVVVLSDKSHILAGKSLVLGHKVADFSNNFGEDGSVLLEVAGDVI